MPVPTAANSSFTGGVGCWPWCVVWLKDKCQLCHDCSTRKHFHFGLCEFNALPQRDGGLERRADRQADTNRMGLRIHPSILTSIHSAQAGPMCWAAHYAKQIALSCCNTVWWHKRLWDNTRGRQRRSSSQLTGWIQWLILFRVYLASAVVLGFNQYSVQVWVGQSFDWHIPDLIRNDYKAPQSENPICLSPLIGWISQDEVPIRRMSKGGDEAWMDRGRV